jgi:glycosyltransferase involved in cell wall biosynthesis
VLARRRLDNPAPVRKIALIRMGKINGVRWLGWVPGSGFGNATVAYLSALRDAGVNVSWDPMGWSSTEMWRGLSREAGGRDGFVHDDIVHREIEHNVVVVHSTPLRSDLFAEDWGPRAKVAFSAIEVDRAPETWIAIFNRYDALVVPSEFNRQVFAAAGARGPIWVVPHIARAATEAVAAGPGRAERVAPFTFYTITTWTTRKAVLETVEAYLQAFSAGDPVRLVIHCQRYSRAGAQAGVGGIDPTAAVRLSLARMLAGRHRLPDIMLSTDPLSNRQIEQLHQAGDCFVSLSRGEGFGLNAFEAAAFGNPCVITGWGGWLDYVPEAYPFLVDYDLVTTLTEPPDSGRRSGVGERWARARIGHAAELMRRVFDAPDDAAEWGRRMQAKVLTEFDRTVVANRLIEVLRSVV